MVSCKITTLRKNLDYRIENLPDFSNQVSRFPSKKEIIELIKLIDIKTPKPVEIEIKKLIESLQKEVKNIKQTQLNLQKQLDLVKGIASE